MKTNKGIIGIGLIVAIVLGIAVVGGGAYYLGKGSSEKEVINPVVNTEVNLPDEDKNGLPDFATLPHEYGDESVAQNSKTDCTPNSTPSIKVLSPNGGEVFKAGDKMIIKWDICNDAKNGIEELKLGSFPYIHNNDFKDIDISNLKKEDKMLAWTIPLNTDITKKFKIYIKTGMFIQGNTEYELSDDSDNSFTINSAKVSPSSDMKLLSFKANKGEFLAETPRLVNSSDVEVKVYYFPTGTGITKPSLLGSMYPLVGASGSIQTWSLPAYLEPNTNNKQSIMATSIYATLYIGGKEINTINYPVIGASAIYDSIYGNDSAVSVKDNNLIKLTSCGVSLTKTSDWSVISNIGNEIKLDILGDTHTGFAGIDIKCVLGNSITDTDAKFGNITYFYDTGKKAWMETDNQEGEGITPNTIPVLAKPLFTTTDGFPVFRGTGRWLTYIVAISPNSILSLNEGDTEGGYTQTLTNLVKTIKKL